MALYSPLLLYIVLDELDKELERRELQFAGYADDFQSYVGTRRSAERIMVNIGKVVVNKLRPKVHEAKSIVGPPRNRSSLGYRCTTNRFVKLKPAKKSV
jgi:retron-type reverse transcriptase